MQGALATTPELSIVKGLARTLRSESLAKFVVLEMEPHADHLTERLAKFVAFICRTSFWDPEASNTVTDMEYREEAGGLHVPRVCVNEELNRRVNQLANQQTSCRSTTPFANLNDP